MRAKVHKGYSITQQDILNLCNALEQAQNTIYQFEAILDETTKDPDDRQSPGDL
jgi:hypothetical protein